MSTDGVAREKEAARTIAVGAVAPDTTVSVVGFGSSDGSPGQTAAITRCPPTKVDSAQHRDSLARCIGDVHARTDSEGWNTDHVAALRQALGLLAGSTAKAKIVFLLTDGNLDVTDSPAYGRDPGSRNQAAAAQIPGVLAQLSEAGAQVWPLGFGNEVSLENLKAFQTGNPCSPTVPKPEARVIANPAVLRSAIIEAYRSASCVGGGKFDEGVLPPGPSTLDLKVTIPAIASDSSILVYKRHAGVQVEYIDPNNQTVSGDPSNGSTFEFAGQGTETESLHIVDPLPGIWTVRLSASSTVPQEDVAATVLFQGEVNAVLTVNPPQPAAGQDVEVGMQLRARRSAITDPDVLSGLSFQLSMTGSSGVSEQHATLTDVDRNGIFTAHLRVPASAAGDLTFTGTVSGIGIGGDTRVFTTTVRKQAADLQGQLRLTGTDSTIAPGASVAGEASIENKSGRERTLRLQLVNPGPGTLATLTPPTIQVPASGSVTVPFSIEFAPNTLIGGNQALLQVVDDADPTSVVTQQLVARDVAPPPTLFMRWLWLWIALAGLAVAGLFVIISRLVAARRQRWVEGLRVELRHGGIPVHELEPLNSTATVFRFGIHDDGFTQPQLQHANSSDAAAYELRRARGQLTLTPASGQPLGIQPGETHPIGRDLDLVVHDQRAARRSGAPPDGSRGSATPTTWDPFSGAVGATQLIFNHHSPGAPYPPPSDPWAAPTQPPQSNPGHTDYGRWKDPHDPWSNS